VNGYADEWRSLKLGQTELTVVVPAFTRLRLEKGRWMPISSEPEFTNQVAIAQWRAASTSGLFVLIPNRKAMRDVSWAAEGEGLIVRGPGWTDHIRLDGARLHLVSSDGGLKAAIGL